MLSACKAASPILTTKKEIVKSVNKAKPVVKSETIQKKVREPEIAVRTEETNNKPPDGSIEIDDEFKVNSKNNNNLSKEIIETALDNLDSRYRTGGTTKAGFDCSGLIYATFSKFNIKLPRTSNEMSRFGIKININDAKKGDLIFFRTLGNKNINHVGLIVEINDDEIKFVHSSIRRGVIVSTTKEGYYKKTFAQINRVLE